MSFLLNTPKKDGFKMPAENESHAAIIMAWPERRDNWRADGIPAKIAFSKVAQVIIKTTPVIMIVSERCFKEAREMLEPEVEIIIMEYDDIWMRDIGPTFVVNDKGERRGIDWIFNAWGGLVNGLYSPWENDDKIASAICIQLRNYYYRAPIVLEGGAFHVDGEGTLYTTEECLLNEGRNPFLEKNEISEHLKNYLNVETVIWLPYGLYNDETNGHIDNIMHIVKPGEVVLAWTDDENDPQYERSKMALEALSSQRDAKGRNIIVHKLLLPRKKLIPNDYHSEYYGGNGVKRYAGEQLAASYTNYLITNKSIIYPLLDCELDDLIKERLCDLYPYYTVTGVDSLEILLGGGNIHCITQQVPVDSTNY